MWLSLFLVHMQCFIMMFMHSMSNIFPKFYYVLAVILDTYYENVFPDYFCLFSTFPVSRHVWEVFLHIDLSFSSQKSLLQQYHCNPDCWTQDWFVCYSYFLEFCKYMRCSKWLPPVSRHFWWQPTTARAMLTEVFSCIHFFWPPPSIQ